MTGKILVSGLTCLFFGFISTSNAVEGCNDAKTVIADHPDKAAIDRAPSTTVVNKSLDCKCDDATVTPESSSVITLTTAVPPTAQEEDASVQARVDQWMSAMQASAQRTSVAVVKILSCAAAASYSGYLAYSTEEPVIAILATATSACSVYLAGSEYIKYSAAEEAAIAEFGRWLESFAATAEVEQHEHIE